MIGEAGRSRRRRMANRLLNTDLNKENGRNPLVPVPQWCFVRSGRVYVTITVLCGRGSGGLLVPVGLAGLLDLFVLLFLSIGQECLDPAVAVLTDAVHL
jgi:hypothetical protein